MSRKLTFNEVETIVAIEVLIVKESGDLDTKELNEFEEIIRTDIQTWELSEYYAYMKWYYERDKKKKSIM
jgi:hypothetical protein